MFGGVSTWYVAPLSTNPYYPFHIPPPSPPMQPHFMAHIVTVDFTTHGGSHIYGLPCPSVDSLDPMDHFCTFDVSKIIPKNTHYFLYATFKPFLSYTRGYNP